MDAQMIGIDGDRDAECSGVLGRDFLSVCRFYYDGPRGAFVIDCGEFDKRDSISEAIRRLERSASAIAPTPTKTSSKKRKQRLARNACRKNR